MHAQTAASNVAASAPLFFTFILIQHYFFDLTSDCPIRIRNRNSSGPAMFE